MLLTGQSNQHLAWCFPGYWSKLPSILVALLYTHATKAQLEGGTYLLVVKDGYQKLFKLHYDFEGRNVQIIPSPDGERIAYAAWENVGYSFYVMNKDRPELQLISRQHVGEGSGGVDLDTFSWTTDGNSITYTETAMTCPNTCDEPGDFVNTEYRYTINVQTLEESREEIR